MDDDVKQWLLNQRCSTCREGGRDTTAGVMLMLEDDETGELELLAFCYECAYAVLTRRRQLE